MHIVDAHHHLWDPADRDYPFMRPAAFDPIRRRYGLDDLRARADAAGVAATVLVQTVSDTTETREFLDVAAASDGLVAGVVGWADLTSPAFAAELDELRSGPAGRWLVGLRHQVETEPDAGWLQRPDVRRAMTALESAGLVYDLLIRADQAASAVELAHDHDQLSFVLDHAGKPPVAGGAVPAWREWISGLAAAPNVYVKLSGLATEADWASWAVADLRPYVEVMLELFGPERIMVGTDWPVCELAAPYGRVIDAATELTAHLSASERHEMFAGTARRVYGIK